MACLGIDIGTSAVKLCVTDMAGAVLATADAPLRTAHPSPGASEQDPRDWVAAMRRALASLPAVRRADIAAIGLSGQMHGAVLLDHRRDPIRPAILWNDGRAQAECDAMAADLPQIGQIAGVPAMPGFTAPKLRWLHRTAPGEHARIRHILLPKDFIGLHLHGELVTDPSDAAGSHWLDQASGTWSDALCAISATDRAWLPELRHGTDIAGYLLPDIAADLGLPPGIPVATGAGDAAAGAIGIGATQEGDGFISLGTSGQLFVTTDSYRPNPDSLVHAYAHTLPGRWFQMACMLNGARPMAWLADLLGQPIPDLLRKAEVAPAGPLYLPYLTGERTPHGDTRIRAGFQGLGEDTTDGSLMRAVVEAIAFSFADAAEALAAAGTRPAHLLAIGGGTRSDFLLQMMADVLQTPIGRSDNADIGPALGAARLARLALTDAPLAEVAPKPAVTRLFQPTAGAASRMAPRLAAYRQLYAALRSVDDVLHTGAT